MSKINNNNKTKDVHSHNAPAYEFIDAYLPCRGYVDLVIKKMKEKKIKDIPSKSIIRNVRNQTNFRTDILLVLVEVAKDCQKTAEKIKEIINT